MYNDQIHYKDIIENFKYQSQHTFILQKTIKIMKMNLKILKIKQKILKIKQKI